MDKLLTSNEAADYLRIHRATLYTLTQHNNIESFVEELLREDDEHP